MVVVCFVFHHYFLCSQSPSTRTNHLIWLRLQLLLPRQLLDLRGNLGHRDPLYLFLSHLRCLLQCPPTCSFSLSIASFVIHPDMFYASVTRQKSMFAQDVLLSSTTAYACLMEEKYLTTELDLVCNILLTLG